MSSAYPFDAVQDFSGLLSVKWNFRKEKTGNPDVLPMWVADMDFPAAPEIRDALVQRAARGLYGYAAVTDGYRESVTAWFRSRYHWNVSPDDLVQTPGVVTALHVLVGAFSEAGDGVVIQTPAYPPFFRVARTMRRRVVENPLRRTEQGFSMDFAGLEALLVREKPKLFILCNPHNPTGTVFGREELEELDRLCREHGVMVLADEIHGDLHYTGAHYIPFASLSSETAQTSATCTAPSKTFNLAGLGNSNIIIQNASLRARYEEVKACYGIPGASVFGLVATEAAYRHGGAWLEQAVRYLEGNRDFAAARLRERLPHICFVRPQGTYFLWLDFSALGLEDAELEQFMLHKAGLWLNPGITFGAPGKGHMRMNFACPRSRLEQALEQLAAAVR